ncbi:MAG: ATP-binding protein [Ginsengibacter sp.]
MEAIKKFVVIGPESTGKTTLCNKLAKHYHTLWVPEFAREYLLKNGTEYSFEDLLVIARQQVELEEAGISQLTTKRKALLVLQDQAESVAQESHRLIFIDTDMYVMKVWCEYVFNKCHTWILNRIAERKYDGYILCNPDIEWVRDELREYPDKITREKLYYYYRDLMANQEVPWLDVKGNYDERFKKATNFIDSLC